jgi:3-oxoadipate enol-lactonase
MTGEMERLEVEVEPGVSLAVSIRQASVGRSTILFSNSLAADQSMWANVIGALPNTVGVVTYDTRGHGGSSIVASGFGVDGLGADVVSLVEQLDLKRPIFCGLSLGGLTGQWLGLHHADKFSALLLANTAMQFLPFQMWIDRARAVRDGGMQPMVKATLKRWLTDEFRQQHPDIGAKIYDMIAATPPEGYAACCEVLAATNLTGALANCPLPILRIAGAYDLSTPPELLDAIEVPQDQPGVALIDAAHLCAAEKPAEFARLIEMVLHNVEQVHAGSGVA